MGLRELGRKALDLVLREAPSERRALTYDDLRPWAGEPTAAGMPVSHDSASGIAAIWKARQLYANKMAICPLHVFQRGDSESDVRKRLHGHRLQRLLNMAPNDLMTAASFWRVFADHLLFWGNSYSEIERDNAYRPIALWPMNPSRVRVETKKENGRTRLKYLWSKPTGGEKELDQDDVLHVPGLSFDGILGYSVIFVARQSLGLNLALERNASAFFGQGSQVGLVLKWGSEKELTPEIKNNLRESWRAMHQGPDKAHRLAILEEGLGIEKIGIPPEDAQFLQSREWSVVDVSRWFNVPPALLGYRPGQGPGGNLEAQQLEFLTESLQIFLVATEQECGRKLLPEREQSRIYLEHMVEAILRMDAKTRMELLSRQVSYSQLTVNEARRLSNLPGVEGGDRPLVLSTLVPLADAGSGGAQSAPSPADGAGPGMDDLGWSRQKDGWLSVGAHSGLEDTPTQARARVDGALVELLADTIGRFARSEAHSLRKVMPHGSDAIRDWMGRFYDGVARARLEAMLAPPLGVMGVRSEAQGVATAYCNGSQEALTDALGRGDQASVDARLEELATWWVEGRTLELAAHLVRAYRGGGK